MQLGQLILIIQILITISDSENPDDKKKGRRAKAQSKIYISLQNIGFFSGKPYRDGRLSPGAYQDQFGIS